MARRSVRKFGGDIRFWRKSTLGVLTPCVPEANDPDLNQPIITDALTTTYEAGNEVSVTSKGRGADYGATVWSETEPGTGSISVTLKEIPASLLARIFYGESSAISVTAGSVTDQDLVVSAKNLPLQLPHRYIKASPAPVVNNSGTPLTAGTDYTIDLRRGTIVIKAAGVNVDDTLTLDYSFDDVSGTRILGGTTPTETFYITGDMEDRVSGEQGALVVYEAQLTLDGDIDWFSSEVLSPTLTGKMIKPVDAPAAYTFDMYEQAA